MWFRGRGKADRAIAAYQRELVDTHYREVENMYRQMRMWQHDYRNHLQTMKALDTPDQVRQCDGRRDSEQQDVACTGAWHRRARGRPRIPIKPAHFGTRFVLTSSATCSDNAIEANDGLPESRLHDSRVYGHEGHAAVHLVHQRFLGRQAAQGRWALPHHQIRRRGTVSGWSTSTRSSRLRALPESQLRGRASTTEILLPQS